MMDVFFFIALLLHWEMSVGQKIIYFHITEQMGQIEAQSYCRQNYEDIAIIITEEENQRIIDLVTGTKIYGWIGLTRPSPTSSEWTWSNGEKSSFFKWYTGQPTNTDNENCANAGPLGWNDKDCNTLATFFCYKTLTLVNEMKTWIEALEYCNSKHKGLACLTSGTQLSMADTLAAETQTVKVWTGLRFLDGKWLWLNREPLGSGFDLPSCPTQRQLCGARNFDSDVWENQDCDEKLNFICF